MPNLHKISVLIVEDNLPMLELAKSIFLSFGVGEVITAQDGEEGFRLFCKFSPDIVVVDWKMAPVNGIELAKKIRRDIKSPNMEVPIILITAHSDRERAMEARDAGVTDFLVKPFNARDLCRRVAKVLEDHPEFVRAEDYFGPDRRRHINGFSGLDKRGDNSFWMNH